MAEWERQWEDAQRLLDALMANPQAFFEQVPNQVESPILEYKASFGYDLALDLCPHEKKNEKWNPRNPGLEQIILETVIAFANTSGGLLVLGVSGKNDRIVDADQLKSCAERGLTQNVLACHAQLPTVRSVEVDGALRICGINRELGQYHQDFGKFKDRLVSRFSIGGKGQPRDVLTFAPRRYPCSVNHSKTVEVALAISPAALIKDIVPVNYLDQEEGQTYRLCAILVAPAQDPVYIGIGEKGGERKRILRVRGHGQKGYIDDMEVAGKYVHSRFHRSATQVVTQISTPGQGSFDMKFWSSIELSNDPEDFDAYLSKYPNGEFVTLAANRLKRLRVCLEGTKLIAPAQQQDNPEPVQNKPPIVTVPPLSGGDILKPEKTAALPLAKVPPQKYAQIVAVLPEAACSSRNEHIESKPYVAIPTKMNGTISISQQMQARARGAVAAITQRVDANIAHAHVSTVDGDFDGAIATYTNAINDGFRQYELLLDRADVYMKKIDYENALNDVSLYICKLQNNAAAYVKRANIYRLRGDVCNALQDLNEAILIDPDYAEALEARADIYRNTCKYALAVADYSAALRITPDCVALLFKRADVHEKAGDEASALKDRKYALQIKRKK